MTARAILAALALALACAQAIPAYVAASRAAELQRDAALRLHGVNHCPADDGECDGGPQ